MSSGEPPELEVARGMLENVGGPWRPGGGLFQRPILALRLAGKSLFAPHHHPLFPPPPLGKSPLFIFARLSSLRPPLSFLFFLVLSSTLILKEF